MNNVWLKLEDQYGTLHRINFRNVITYYQNVDKSCDVFIIGYPSPIKVMASAAEIDAMLGI